MLVGSAVSVGLTSRMGDIYGHRKVLIALIVLAMAGCALAGSVSGFWPLVIGRFLMGLAVAIPLCWGLLRPRATALQVQRISIALSTVMAIFSPVALVIGGFIVGLGLPWESVFWASFVLYAVLLILAGVSPETPAAARARVRLDWFGALGLGIWVTALLIGISEGPALGWTSPVVIGSFIVCAVTLAVWVVQQRRTEEPMVSFRNMDVRQTLIGFSAILAIFIVGNGIFILLPALLQTPTSSGFGHGLSPLEASYVLLAMLPGAAVAYAWTRWGLQRFGPKTVLVLSGAAAVLVFLGLAFAHDSVWISYVWVFLYAATLLSCWNTGFALVAAAGRQDNTAVTFGLQNITQFVGMSVTVAIVLNLMVPGADGFIPEDTFVSIYVAFAVILVALVVLWAVFAPARMGDRHAIDTEADPTKVHAAAY